ncbi:MAG: YbaK/EbsC family protein [Actinomycetota bacterium]|jgi:prolyl-tRNA editing enzyme YbaK/EbsC (Cys-tRNA(Pro) deacylase)|nr:YbaK/EbsC family protein [Actinomycetota bacterium]
MHRNVQRVQEALRAAGSDAQVLELSASTRTSAEAAAAIGVEVGQIAKSLVFVVDGEPVVAVLSGVDRLDTEKLRTVLAGGTVERADADTVRSATGFPIGGVSPVGHRTRVLVDGALAAYDVVWAAAGTPNAVYPTTFGELVAASGGEVADLRVDDAGSGAQRA